MHYAYTNAQMREADNRTIANGTPAQMLMERAGDSLARAVKEAMGRLRVSDCLFVCGGGNNGGDGFVAARILQEQGAEVQVLCLAEHFSNECGAAKKQYRGEIMGRIPRRRYALVVDCLFGTGLTRAPSGEYADLVEFINHSGAYVIACDLPSGLGEGGVAFSPCVKANETVCIGQLKSALLLADGADVAGKITVAEIGIPAEGGAEVWDDGDVKRFFPKRNSNSNKGTYGSACVLGGSMTGAAFLAAGACLKSGVGYAKLYLPPEVYPYAVGKLPACILREFSGVDGEICSANCIALGMGAGVSEELYAQIEALLADYMGTLVLDADALNTLSVYGTAILKKKKCRVVVTPHPKEFSRLTGKSVDELLSCPEEAAKSFACENGATVVFKNNRTVISDGERVAINPTGSPALAKGGSGDVLAGFLAGTCGRGVPAFEAACIASYVLGRAGEIAANELGEYAPDATDVITCLARVTKELEQK